METPFGKILNQHDIDSVSGYDNSVTMAEEMWLFMDYLRGYDLEEVGPHILFLLTLDRFSYLDGLNSWEELKVLMSSDDVEDLPHGPVLRELYQNGNLLMNYLDLKVEQEVFNRVKDLASDGTKVHFARFFDDLLYRLFSINSKRGGEYLLTNQIRSLMIRLAGIAERTDVFSPFAGLVSFGLHLPQGTSFYGQELNDKTYDFARLRAVAHDLEIGESFKINREDSFLKWPYGKEFDLIISAPPFGLRLARYAPEIVALRNAENFLVRKGVELLKASGKLVTLVSASFLSRSGSEKETRKFLIESDLVETLILLPRRMMNGSAINAVVLVINKNKKTKGAIKMASPGRVVLPSEDERIDRKRSVFVGDVVAWINAMDDPESGVYPSMPDLRLISNDEVAENDYSLDVPRYLLPDFEGIPLADLLSAVAGTPVRANFSGRLTTVKDLVPENQVDYKVSFRGLTEEEALTGDYRLPRSTKQVNQSVVLVATVGRNLKPTYFHGDSRPGGNLPVYLSPQVKAFSYDKDRLDLDYLVYQLRSEAVKEQLRAYQTGSTMSRITVRDFLRIKIQLPPLTEQVITMRAFREVDAKMNALRRERNALAHGTTVAGGKRFATLKHALGRPQQSILSAAKTIRDYLDRAGEEGAKLNRAYAAFFEQERNISDTLQGIINDIDFISRMMDRGENGLQPEAYQLKEISAREVLNFVKSLNTDGLKFKLEIIAEPDKEWNETFFLLNQELLRLLIDNLFTNADRHAFKQIHPGNIVQITLFVIDGHLVLEVQNNGMPFPKNFGKEQYIQEFKTSGTGKGQGIGGYQIDQIAKYFFNPDWELKMDAGEVFPVTFIFRFPAAETVDLTEDDDKITSL